jgi:hypothetical protein
MIARLFIEAQFGAERRGLLRQGLAPSPFR